MVSANRKTLKKSTQFKTIAREGVKNGFILGLCPNKGGFPKCAVLALTTDFSGKK